MMHHAKLWATLGILALAVMLTGMAQATLTATRTCPPSNCGIEYVLIQGPEYQGQMDEVTWIVPPGKVFRPVALHRTTRGASNLALRYQLEFDGQTVLVSQNGSSGTDESSLYAFERIGLEELAADAASGGTRWICAGSHAAPGSVVTIRVLGTFSDPPVGARVVLRGWLEDA